MSNINVVSNFSIRELTYSKTAVDKGISNVPSTKELASLMYAITQLERVRTILNDCSMLISSGYRCKALNRLVGGVPTSAHVQGLAVDFTSIGYGNTTQIVDAIYKSGLQYDQLILEYPNKASSWVHIGWAAKGVVPRQQTLVTTAGTYSLYKP